MKLNDHPTVRHYREAQPSAVEDRVPTVLEADELRQLCLEAGADDVGFVEIDRPELGEDRPDVLALFPAARSLISFVCRMNREPIRSPARSVANVEFHRTGDHTNDVAHRIVAALERRGVRAVNPAMGFPMEMDRFPGKVWVVSHKPVAVAAGLGQIGIHRNVIHPKFGNFILLGTILLDRAVSRYDRPLDYNPCLECKLCVTACPTGAIGADGRFDFSACYTHNYREFMGGFTDWVEQVVSSRSAREYRAKVSDTESASMWQSLSYGANYKAAYCLAACPAGDDVIAPFLLDRKAFIATVVQPLTEKSETVYVVPGSDAEVYVPTHFPRKRTKAVGNGLRPRTITDFLRGLPLVFQRGQAKGLEATFHFTFTGDEPCEATVMIAKQRIEVQPGHIGIRDLHVRADSHTWLGFIRKERSLLWALLRGTIRMTGSLRLLKAFGRCVPS